MIRISVLLCFIFSLFSCSIALGNVYTGKPTTIDTLPIQTDIDSCNTWTYRMNNGAINGQMVSTETLTAFDGNNYLLGYVTGSDNRLKGLLQFLDKSGTVTWSKVFGTPNRDIVFKNIRQLNSGNFYIIGTTALPNGSDKRILIIETDKNGITIRSKTLAIGGFEGIGISPTTNNGIGFCGQNDSLVVYGKLDYAGNLVWLKSVQLARKGSLVGMAKYDYNTWYIAYNAMDSGRHVGFLLSINASSGILNWTDKIGGVAANTDFIFHDMELTNIRPRIVGIYARNKQPYQLFKLTINATSGIERIQTFNVPSIVFDTTAKSVITPWGNTIAFTASGASNTIYTVNVIGDSYPDTLQGWAKKYQGSAQYQLVNIEQSFDGGMLIGTNTIGGINNGRSYFFKTDSTGAIKNCEGLDYTITNTVTYNPPYSPLSISRTDILTTFNAENVIVSNEVLQNDFDCKDMICRTAILIPNCVSTFNHKYGSNNASDLALSMLVDSSDITLIGSTTYGPIDPTIYQGFIARLDHAGKLKFRKRILLGKASGVISLLSTIDNGFLILGYSYDKSPFTSADTFYYTITKYTKDFKMAWSQSFPYSLGYGGIAGFKESYDGSIFLSYFDDNAFCQILNLLKFSANGNLIWQKKITNINCIIGNGGNMTQDRDHVYIAYYNAGTSSTELYKVDKQTGNLVWLKRFTIANTSTMAVASNMGFINNNIVLQGYINTNGVGNTLVMIIDTSGKVLRNKTLQYTNKISLNCKMTVTKNYDILLYAGDSETDNLIRLDSNLNVLFSKRIFSQISGARDIKEMPDNNILTTGSFIYSSSYRTSFSLRKLTPEGNLGACPVDTLVLLYGSQFINVTTSSASVTNKPIVLYNLPYTEIAYDLQLNQIFCNEVANCNTLQFTNANNALCDTLVHTLGVTRNAGCTLPIFFSYDSSVSVINKTDSSISIKALKAGQSILRARIFNGCNWIETSTNLRISMAQSYLNLGNDTAICATDSLRLNAKSGFLSYKWSNGATDTAITVKVGRYFVTVTDACGNLQSDTITIKTITPDGFSAGSDKIICAKDTTHILAPAGFKNYVWLPNYNISITNSNNAIVAPMVDTSYYVKATDSHGCTVLDTIGVKVNPLPTINLGKDTALCSGNILVLDAGANFSKYTWDDGSINQTRSVTTAGSYSVVVSNSLGCKAADTLIVQNIWPKPIVSLDKNAALCKGDTRVLDAGRFKDYLWQDGSKAQYLSVVSIGKYYVRVTDINGCQSSDTTSISQVLPLPANFLPRDTAICSYESIVIRALNNYPSYLWNTGDISQSITIKQPNIYSLKVQDTNGCIGIDSITINSKACKQGIYFPSGFTPDNNYRNDVFKPIVFGVLTDYEFSVYNRFGQIIFATKDTNRGWDGKVNGLQQPIGTFVFLCRYQFPGDVVKYEKGSFVLIR